MPIVIGAMCIVLLALLPLVLRLVELLFELLPLALFFALLLWFAGFLKPPSSGAP